MEAVPGIEAAFIDEGWSRRVVVHPPAPVHASRPDDYTRITLSSGTTGAPKGALTTQIQSYHRFVQGLLAFGWSAEDRYLACVPFCFSAGRGYPLYILRLGGVVVLMPTIFTAAEYVAMVERHDITAGLLTPTPLRWLLEHRRDREPLLPGPKRLATVGAPIHPEEKAALYRRVVPGLIEVYSTSATGILTRLAGEDLVNRGETMGRLLPTASVEVVDDAGNLLPIGAEGTLRIGGPGTTTELVGDDGSGGAASVRDGWYYPGDLVRIDEEGYLHLRGRSADLIIRGGVNIYPAEIEQVLLAHARVAEAAVVGWPSRLLGEEVAAFVRPRGPLEVGELRALCLERLVGYKVPRGFFLVEDLPRTSAGKVRKAALKAGLTPL
jgi:acyl-coenzyme A synthetase/AMP-(fatty) acid ligase